MSRTAERIDATHDDAPQAAALLTIKQAADLLHVERAYLIQLLDGGSLPFTGKGNQRHIHEDDLIAYQQGRDPFRRAALRNIYNSVTRRALMRWTPKIPGTPNAASDALPIALLDAKVLLTFDARDTIRIEAEGGLCTIDWTTGSLRKSSAIIRRSLHGTEDEKAAKAARAVSAMRTAFPEARITGWNDTLIQMTVDPGDRPLRHRHFKRRLADCYPC